MNNIPIFDCLTHPTLNGDWIQSQYHQKNDIYNLLSEMESNNICNAFAVGMKNIGGYDEAIYSDYILSKSEKLLPIAFINPSEFINTDSVIAKLKYLKSKNYCGIKLHPRIGNFNLSNSLLPEIIKAANNENLVVLFCTYFYQNNEDAVSNNFENLVKLLIKIPDEKIILLHAGTVRLLEMMEIARAFKNVMLDLSFTLCKYAGSSLDMDIQFLFNNFDRRICVGSDSPQFTLNEFRQRFNFFTENMDTEKVENIAYKNLYNFLKI